MAYKSGREVRKVKQQDSLFISNVGSQIKLTQSIISMQVIDRPKKYSLPLQLSRRIETENSINGLPSIYLYPKSSKQKFSEGSTKSIIKYSSLEESRGSIRAALAKKMTFEHIEGCEHAFLPEEVLRKIAEKVKPLNYSSSEFKEVFERIKQIFGEDFSITFKDILATKGQITGFHYVFFTAAFYRPQSFCCSAMIYLKLQPISNSLNPEEKTRIDTYFICSECKKGILKLSEQGQLGSKRLVSPSKKQSQINEQRNKIMMAIMVASGRYKKERIGKSPGKQSLLKEVGRGFTVPVKRAKIKESIHHF